MRRSGVVEEKEASRLPALRVLLAILLGILATLGAGIAASLIAQLFGGPEQAPAWLTGVANHTGMVLVSLVLIAILSHGRWDLYGFRRPHAFSLTGVLIWSGGISALAFLIGALLPEQDMGFMEEYPVWQEILFIWIYASLAEEVVTRGLVQGFLDPLRGRGIRLGGLLLSTPVLVGALFFGAMHLSLFTVGFHPAVVIRIVIFATLIGLVAGYYRERSRSLWPAFLAHASANVVGSVLGWITGVAA
ncbi:MAG: CPBP family intramembrane metalloprotease [Candidatus Eisenbacteria bacterium]|nr:CPBP family intramembrane metalloprotease [Candidatus Eisenbacteria bacterium]